MINTTNSNAHITQDHCPDDSCTEQVTDRLEHLPILFNNLQLNLLTEPQRNLVAMIDSVLPQTQCGLCDHPDGCLPYATAIVTNREPYNKCVPGGQPVTDAIASLLNQHQHDLSGYDQCSLNPPTLTAAPSKWPTDSQTGRPIEVRAVIREEDCIGCTKCIPACPVDAIVGTGKHMHTIFTDLCTGCELCLPPCPVDCIDLVEIEHHPSDIDRLREQADLRQRYHTHLDRVAEQMADKSHAKPVISMVEAKLGNVTNQTIDIDAAEAKTTIAAAKLRSKIKKLEKQLSVRDNTSKREQLTQLKQALEELFASS